jgi:hypothetical protein
MLVLLFVYTWLYLSPEGLHLHGVPTVLAGYFHWLTLTPALIRAIYNLHTVQGTSLTVLRDKSRAKLPIVGPHHWLCLLTNSFMCRPIKLPHSHVVFFYCNSVREFSSSKLDRCLANSRISSKEVDKFDKLNRGISS